MRTMNEFELLQVVALRRDLPEHGLQTGDVGTIVEIVGNGAILIVEFMEASGHTRALLDLPPDDIRPVVAGEMLTVRENAPPYN